MSTFKREVRYVVLKLSHMSVEQQEELNTAIKRIGLGTIDCVVVEKDWPEYESTFKAIEKRVLRNKSGRGHFQQ